MCWKHVGPIRSPEREVPWRPYYVQSENALGEGDVNFGVAAWCSRVHHSGDAFKVQSDT